MNNEQTIAQKENKSDVMLDYIVVQDDSENLRLEPSPEDCNYFKQALLPKENSEQKLYAIISAGIGKKPLLEQLDSIHQANSLSLLPGDEHYSLREVSPLLIELNKQEHLLSWLLEKGWGKHWGIYIHTTVDFSVLYHHLYTLTSVWSPEGKKLFFRYYDPRVLRPFLGELTKNEVNLFFGPIDALFVEQESPLHLKQYQRPHDLKKPDPAPTPKSWTQLPKPRWKITEKQWLAIEKKQEDMFLEEFKRFLMEHNVSKNYSNSRWPKNSYIIIHLKKPLLCK